MEFDVISLFPQLVQSVFSSTVIERAYRQGIFQVHLHQLRDFTDDTHKTVDDQPYGGGAGMVMRCEPLFRAWEHAKNRNTKLETKTILFSPAGQPLNQESLENWAQLAHSQRLILVCGRYEGIDQRFVDQCVDLEVSLGDFVLSGGEIPAMALIDGVVRLLPNVLGNGNSVLMESFSLQNKRYLECPQYTRPPEFRGQFVPEVLLSGNHKKIDLWREEQARERTRKLRPDLFRK